MDPHVGLQVPLFCEGLPATRVGALEGLLSRVGAHVDLEAARSGVALVADVANVGLVPRMN